MEIECAASSGSVNPGMQHRASGNRTVRLPLVAVHVALLLLTAGMAGCSREAAPPTSGISIPRPKDTTSVNPKQPDLRLLKADSEPQNWLTHGGTYSEQRYSALAQVTTSNVGRLGLAWSLELDTNRGQETTPLVVDGTVYVTTAWSKVVAIDGASGRQKWQYDPKVPPQTAVNGCCDVVNRGAAYYDGKIYVGTFDGRLVALDAATGALLWSVVTTDPKQPYSITGAPRVVKGNVVIGNAGAEAGVRGYVSAYNAQTGKQVWRFYTIPGDPNAAPDGAASDEALRDKANGTWFGHWYRYGGGGTVWDAIVYDAELDQLYIGVGNGAPWNHKIRSEGKGDNLFLSSIVALDPDTGKYRWHYQVNPGESWDFTASQPIILANLKIDGRDRKVLMQAPKNGYFYVINRQDGKLISAQNFVPVTWATGIDLKTGRPREVPGARYENKPFLMAPSAYGGHSWYPMSFSPKTGLVYFPTQEVPAYYENQKDFKMRRKSFNTGAFSSKNLLPTDPKAFAEARKSMVGALIAWDPIAQREVWRIKKDGPASGGTLATAGGLVFEGDQRGRFQAYAAKDGKLLWKFTAQTAILGSPVSYRIGSDQYVLVVSGQGGGYALNSPFVDDRHRKPNGRVLAFKLDGSAKLPIFTPAALPPANPSPDHFSAAEVARGQIVYETTCGRCHGAAALSGGVLPDLRRTGLLASRDTWDAVLVNGALSERGMVSFADVLSPRDIEDVRAYVSFRAQSLKASEARRAVTTPSSTQ